MKCSSVGIVLSSFLVVSACGAEDHDDGEGADAPAPFVFTRAQLGDLSIAEHPAGLVAPPELAPPSHDTSAVIADRPPRPESPLVESGPVTLETLPMGTDLVEPEVTPAAEEITPATQDVTPAL